MREVLVTELVREVLGPRGGPTELLPLSESPLTEYLTGVLAPITPQRERDADADSEIPSDSAQEYEDEGDDTDVSAPPLTLPALDPKSKPSSMGISFFVRATREPALETGRTRR